MFTLPKGVIPTLYTTPAGLLDLWSWCYLFFAV
jgi:hypothetical protein